VDGVELAVRPGERRALIGPNGAGKTTLFNLIAGALPVTLGRIELFGRDVTRMPPHRRAALGLTRTFQISNLFGTLSVRENCLLAVQALSPVKLAMHRPLSGYRALHARVDETLASATARAPRSGTSRTASSGSWRSASRWPGGRASSCSTSRRPACRPRSPARWRGCWPGWTRPSPC
jgi:ABC-type branched-subunit amino acid transport system ATPase component